MDVKNLRYLDFISEDFIYRQLYGVKILHCCNEVGIQRKIKQRRKIVCQAQINEKLSDTGYCNGTSSFKKLKPDFSNYLLQRDKTMTSSITMGQVRRKKEENRHIENNKMIFLCASLYMIYRYVPCGLETQRHGDIVTEKKRNLAENFHPQ